MVQHALDTVVEGGKSGSRNAGARGKFAEHTMAHDWIGEASASLDAARLTIFSALENLAAIAHANQRPPVEQHVRLRRDYAFGVRGPLHEQ